MNDVHHDTRGTVAKWLIIVAIAMATLYSYQNVRHWDFVNFDDAHYILLNPDVQRNINAESITWAFTTLQMSNYHPITWLSYLMDYELFALNAGGWHVTNVLIHLLNSILLFLLIRKWTSAIIPAALVGLLFAIHPQHVESVAWVSERKDVLSALLLFLTLFAYTEYVQQKSRMWYLVSIILFGIGLMAKPMLVTAPFMLLLFDHWPFDRLKISSDGEQERWYAFPLAYFRKANLHLWKEKIPFFLLTGATAFVTVIAQKMSGAMAGTTTLTAVDRIVNALRSYGRYMYQTIVPTDLSVFYPYPRTVSLLLLVTVLLVLVLVLFAGLKWRKKIPFLATGWLMFIGMLIPVIGLVQVGSQAMADRYVYLPHIGMFIAVVFVLAKFAEKVMALKPVFFICAVGCIVWFMSLTISQVEVWQSSETLFMHSNAVTGGSYTAHNNLSAYYLGERNPEMAKYHALAAMRINPIKASAQHNYGIGLEQLYSYDSAIVYYNNALLRDSTHNATYPRLAYCYFLRGENDKALVHFSRAVENDSLSAKNHHNLGAFLIATGKPNLAIPHLKKAISLEPGFNQPYNSMAMLFLYKKKYTETERFLDRSLELDEDNAAANKYKGDIHALRHQYDSALARYAIALKTQPMNRDLHQRISDILNRNDIDSLALKWNPQHKFKLQVAEESAIE